MGAAYIVASKLTRVCRCRCKGVLTPGLAELFAALSGISAATHSVKILRNKRMVIAWQCKPIHVDSPFVTGISSQSEANAVIDGTSIGLHQAKQLPYDDIGAGNGSDCRH